MANNPENETLKETQKIARRTLVQNWQEKAGTSNENLRAEIENLFFSNPDMPPIAIIDIAVKYGNTEILNEMINKPDTYGAMSFQEKHRSITAIAKKAATETNPQQLTQYETALLSLKNFQMEELHQRREETKSDLKAADSDFHTKQKNFLAKKKEELEFNTTTAPKEFDNIKTGAIQRQKEFGQSHYMDKTYDKEMAQLNHKRETMATATKQAQQDYDTAGNNWKVATKQNETAGSKFLIYNHIYDKIRNINPENYKTVEALHMSQLSWIGNFGSKLGYAIGLYTPPVDAVFNSMFKESSFLSEIKNMSAQKNSVLADTDKSKTSSKTFDNQLQNLNNLASKAQANFAPSQEQSSQGFIPQETAAQKANLSKKIVSEPTPAPAPAPAPAPDATTQSEKKGRNRPGRHKDAE